MNETEEILGAIGRVGREKTVKWILEEKGKFSSFNKAFQNLEVEKFVSAIYDHYDELHASSLNRSRALYHKKFRGIPEEFLAKVFESYQLDEMPQRPPSIPDMWAYAQRFEGFHESWSQYRSIAGGAFCLHCRTDKFGKAGGYREVLIIHAPNSGKQREDLYPARCDCDGGRSLGGGMSVDEYSKAFSLMIKSKYYIFVSEYIEESGCIVGAMEKFKSIDLVV